MARKRKTPEVLDFYFDRDVISEADYRDFWPRWWKGSGQQRREIIRELDLAVEASKVEQFPTFYVTRSLARAKEDAKRVGGYVVRRDKSGRFNSRGRFYQVIHPAQRRKAK